MIELDGIDVSYDNIQVIWDLDFQVSEDDTVVSIVGPNGAGKSTLLRVMSGLHPVDSGRVSVWGTDAAGLNPTEIVEQGFVHVSEERNLFGDMTVRENLQMGAYTDRPTLVDGYVSALDSYHRLRAFDRNSDDRPDGTTLPSGGVPRASIAGVGRTLLVGLNPLIACGIQ